jgi:hypothetical protein
MMARVFTHFDDHQFRLSHMTAPKGRGSWAFQFSLGNKDAWFAMGSCTLAEAKAQARYEAASRVAALRPGAKQFSVVIDILP